MKTYYLEIVVGDHVHDVASVRADNYEGAAKIVDAAAKNRGFNGFSLRETNEEGFIAFKNQKLASESAAAEQPVDPQPLEGNADSAQSETTENTGAPTPAAEDNSESLAGDSQGVPVPEDNDAAGNETQAA
jgi:hypothetical protein